MNKWGITPLVFGWIEGSKSLLTVGLDSDLIMKVPYLGYYLTNGEIKVLVDTGIHKKYIRDGVAWGGLPASGGEEVVVKALREIGIETQDIEVVIYTHLHNDHAGNCHLFKNAKHVFQKAEWAELNKPLPSMKIRGDFDQSVIDILNKCECEEVNGDVQYLPGLSIIQTPGHTKGSQCLIATTKKGNFILTGDTMHIPHIGYGYLKSIKKMNGEKVSVTPVPSTWDQIAPSSLVYDHYAWYDSIYRIKKLFTNPAYILAGHDPSVIGMQIDYK